MKAVYAKWRDSHNYGGWTNPKQDGPYEVDICESIGMLIAKNDDCLTIALHTDMNGSYGNAAVIPNEAIVEYRELMDVES